MKRKWLKAVASGYNSTAIVLFNTVIFFFVLNGAIGGTVWAKRLFWPQENLIIRDYGMETLQKAYPDLTSDQIEVLLDESWSRTFSYEAFTEFKEEPYTGQYVNISEEGFRLGVDQGPWPPVEENISIFVFGGSTTFGYGLGDEQTVPSYIQKAFNREDEFHDVKVYNFGRGYYFSSQERALLERLIVEGQRPDMAIFIDGLNDFYFQGNEAFFTYRLEQIIKGKWGYLLARGIQDLPISLLVPKSLKENVAGFFIERESQPAFDESSEETQARVDEMMDRYIDNAKMIEAIGQAFEIPVLLVWQPVPFYEYDTSYHLFVQEEGFDEQHRYTELAYPLMVDYFEVQNHKESHLSCAHIQKDFMEPLYVDKVHYNAKLAEELAECIVQRAKTLL